MKTAWYSRHSNETRRWKRYEWTVFSKASSMLFQKLKDKKNIAKKNWNKFFVVDCKRKASRLALTESAHGGNCLSAFVFRLFFFQWINFRSKSHRHSFIWKCSMSVEWMTGWLFELSASISKEIFFRQKAAVGHRCIAVVMGSYTRPIWIDILDQSWCEFAFLLTRDEWSSYAFLECRPEGWRGQMAILEDSICFHSIDKQAICHLGR